MFGDRADSSYFKYVLKEHSQDMVNKDSKDIYFKKLKPHKIYFIGVYCDIDVMKFREILRENRTIGLANAQFNVIHRNYKDSYDLTVDTTKTPLFELAAKILSFIEEN